MGRRLSVLMVFVILSLLAQAQQFDANSLEVKLPRVIVSNVSQTITLKLSNDSLLSTFEGVEKVIQFNGALIPVTFHLGEASFQHNFPKEQNLNIAVDGFSWAKDVSPIPLWMSILPPLIAILMALLLREVFVALFIGILTGTTIMYYYQGYTLFVAVFRGLMAIIDTYLMDSLLDRGHMSIIIFSMVIGGMVHLITRNGGMNGVVNRLSKYAKDARSGQFVTWLLGVAIFFDDYANTLVVGNTMRPVTDRLRISREKLAYLVDSTAAPVAATAFVTTWIGAELSYIQDGIKTIGLDESAYTVFFNSLSFSYYPFLTLGFMLLLIWVKRDFGPMFHAEKKARSGSPDAGAIDPKQLKETDALLAVPAEKSRAFNAVFPVLIIVFGTIAGLLFTGWNEQVWQDETISFSHKISTIIGNADSYSALLWSSLSAMLVAVLLTISQRLLSLKETIESLVDGFKMMLTAILILTLAWTVALVTDHMHTADFISQGLQNLSFSPYLVPALTFVLAALVSFSTGSSWGTMAILYPLILPTSWLLTQDSGLDYDASMVIFHNVVSSVLAGSVMGDHCSPISDTTILSSLASSCNHIDHVRTQLPYALTVGSVAVIFGTIPAAFGINVLILFPIAMLVLAVIIRFYGKKTE